MFHYPTVPQLNWTSNKLSSRERAKRSALLAFVGIPLLGNLWIPIHWLWPNVVFATIEHADRPPYQWFLYAFVWTLGSKLSPIVLALSARINPGKQYTYIWLAAALYFVLEALESLMTEPGYGKELMAPAYMLLCYLAFWLTPGGPDEKPEKQKE